MKRPSSTDPHVALPVIERFLALELGMGPEEAPHFLAAVEEAGPHADGEELAEVLEGYYYQSLGDDMEERCEVLLDELDRAQEEAVQQWIADNDIKPRLSVGDKVKVPLAPYLGAKDEDGEIASIDEKRGTYCVRIPSLGHVPKGAQGTLGIIRPFEALHDITPPPEEFQLRAPKMR